jgi:hypothetical protein
VCLSDARYGGGPEWAAVGVLLKGRRTLLIRRVERDGDPCRDRWLFQEAGGSRERTSWALR